MQVAPAKWKLLSLKLAFPFAVNITLLGEIIPEVQRIIVIAADVLPEAGVELLIVGLDEAQQRILAIYRFH